MFWIEITVIDNAQTHADAGPHWIDLEKVARMYRSYDNKSTRLYLNDPCVNFLIVEETPKQILSMTGGVPMPPSRRL